MNDILVLLWFADIAESLKSHLEFLAGILVILGGFCAVVLAVEFKQNWRKTVLIPILGVFIGLVAIFIPSKQWFYIAAGGTAAVKALDSEIGIKVQKLVNVKLDEALGEKK